MFASFITFFIGFMEISDTTFFSTSLDLLFFGVSSASSGTSSHASSHSFFTIIGWSSTLITIYATFSIISPLAWRSSPGCFILINGCFMLDRVTTTETVAVAPAAVYPLPGALPFFVLVSSYCMCSFEYCVRDQYCNILGFFIWYNVITTFTGCYGTPGFERLL